MATAAGGEKGDKLIVAKKRSPTAISRIDQRDLVGAMRTGGEGKANGPAAFPMGPIDPGPIRQRIRTGVGMDDPTAPAKRTESQVAPPSALRQPPRRNLSPLDFSRLIARDFHTDANFYDHRARPGHSDFLLDRGHGYGDLIT